MKVIETDDNAGGHQNENCQDRAGRNAELDIKNKQNEREDQKLDDRQKIISDNRIGEMAY